MSDNGEGYRIDRIERSVESLSNEVRSLSNEVRSLSNEVRNIGEDLRIEVQMRREEIANEREARQRLAQEHYALKDEVDEKFRILLTAQVIMAEGMDELRASLKELSESQKHTDEQFGVLVQMMDSFIRERNKNGSGEQPQA